MNSGRFSPLPVFLGAALLAGAPVFADYPGNPNFRNVSVINTATTRTDWVTNVTTIISQSTNPGYAAPVDWDRFSQPLAPGVDYIPAVLTKEERLASFVPPVSAAKVNHHGHYTMPAALVAALRPRVWLGSVWTLRQFVPPVMERLADRSLYPGERLLCPPFVPPERVAEAREAGTAWLRDIPTAAFAGGHVVLTVPPGGRTFLLEYRSGTGETTFRHRFPSSNERTLS